MFSFSNLSLAGVTAAAASAVLPPGRYICQAVSAKVEDTKSGNGKVLKVMFKCEAGVISDNLNVHNASAEATKIGLEQLKSLLVAGGHPDPDNIGSCGVQSIVGLTVGVVVGNEMYLGEKKSKVRGYYSPDADAAAAERTAPAPAEPIGGVKLPF